MDAAIDYARSNATRFVSELARFGRFASVSAQPEHAADLQDCAAWLAAHLGSIGLERAQVIQTAGHPIVCAEWRRRVDAPTLLLYGHYDVQPAEPLGEWRSPPFAPTRTGDRLVGRGVSDDKGQLLAHVKALESYLRTYASLPVNVVCIFEGEEEIGSPTLGEFLHVNRAALSADAAVVSDTTILGTDRPALTTSVRGLLALELDAGGPARDLHPGKFGGAVVAPLQALCSIVASLHDADGRIAVTGFYDRVEGVSAREHLAMASTGPTDAELLRAAASTASGESGYSLYERIVARPALTVTGLAGGYTGNGVKAVLPSRARARLDVRLVPRQRPSEIDALLRRHISAHAPTGIAVEIKTLSRVVPATCDPERPASLAALAAYHRGFGFPPVVVRSGGTVPVVSLLQQVLGMETVLMGFGLPDDRIHAANEQLHLPTFARAVETCIWFLAELARSSRTPRHDRRSRSPSVARSRPRPAVTDREREAPRGPT